MLVVSVVGETGILLLLLQKQLNTSANRLAFCYAVLLAVFRKILFCFSIQADTVSNIFRFFYFWSPRAWGHSVSPLFFVTPILYFMSHQKSSIISKKPNKGRGVRFAPPYLSKREVPVGRVSRPTSKRSLPFRALLSKSKRVSLPLTLPFQAGYLYPAANRR